MAIKHINSPHNRKLLCDWFNVHKKHSGTLLNYFLEKYVNEDDNEWIGRYALYKDRDKLNMKLSMSTVYNNLACICREGYIDYEQWSDGKFYARLNEESLEKLDNIVCLISSKLNLEERMKIISSQLEKI